MNWRNLTKYRRTEIGFGGKKGDNRWKFERTAMDREYKAVIAKHELDQYRVFVASKRDLFESNLTKSEEKFAALAKSVSKQLKTKLSVQHLAKVSRRMHYIIDFYYPAAKLAIEIDGLSHLGLQAMVKDQIRTNNLEYLGIKLVRFSNTDVWENPAAVESKLLVEVKNRLRK